MIGYRSDEAVPRGMTSDQLEAIVARVRREVLLTLSKERRPEPPPVVLVAPPPPTRPHIPPRVSQILGCAAEAMGIALEHLIGPRRARVLAWPRQVAMLVCVEMAPHASLPQIGRAFNRDHTTIMHGVKAARLRLPTCAYTRELYDAIKAKVMEVAA